MQVLEKNKISVLKLREFYFYVKSGMFSTVLPFFTSYLWEKSAKRYYRTLLFSKVRPLPCSVVENVCFRDDRDDWWRCRQLMILWCAHGNEGRKEGRKPWCCSIRVGDLSIMREAFLGCCCLDLPPCVSCILRKAIWYVNQSHLDMRCLLISNQWRHTSAFKGRHSIAALGQPSLSWKIWPHVSVRSHFTQVAADNV
jgi:hypothetical protein